LNSEKKGENQSWGRGTNGDRMCGRERNMGTARPHENSHKTRPPGFAGEKGARTRNWSYEGDRVSLPCASNNNTGGRFGLWDLD